MGTSMSNRVGSIGMWRKRGCKCGLVHETVAWYRYRVYKHQHGRRLFETINDTMALQQDIEAKIARHSRVNGGSSGNKVYSKSRCR